MSGSFSDSESDYFIYSASSVDSKYSQPGVVSRYASTDVRKDLKAELLGHQSFDQPNNVLDRLGVQKIESTLVERCFQELQSNADFQTQKATLQGLVHKAETAARLAVENNQEDWKRNIKEIRATRLKRPLYKILEQIRKFGGNAQYEREFLSFKKTKLEGERDTFSFPRTAPIFTICDVCGKRSTYFNPKVGAKNIWRLRSAFIELKATSKLGPVDDSTTTITDIVAHAADYARLHISSRPFQLFSVGLLIFGSKFRVAIIDRDGIELSAISDMWEDEGLKLLIRIIRRLCREMSPYDLGMDPNVQLLDLNHPVSQACRQYSQDNIDIPTTHPSHQKEVKIISTYPTYAIHVRGVQYFTIGRPIWLSLSLMGRGTNVWKVTTAQSLDKIAKSHDHIKVIKERYQQMIQTQDSEPQDKYKGSPKGLVEY